MTNRQLDEEAVFHVARVIPTPEARLAYLDQVCAGDQALRERVDALLDVHEREQDFLKSSPEPAPTVDQPPISEGRGHQIGRYKLLQKIGEGGFGVVYMAEQQRPVRRKVALKVIKPGMDTHAVVARFDAERQALALMDHPNISRVFDGGATESGRTYFVMELVKGVPITEYCDKNQLSAIDRLQLFLSVCHAVQHAHQKGIIHRDIKPSNILVTLHDGQPVVKVIDFGVSKAINQQLTEKTLFTAFGQMVGTPQYMSPEQAEISGLDVDTRSDIYSLGILLYELLTGTTPLEGERLRTAGYAEMQRIIREEEPPKPSTRLSGSDERLTTIAKHRSATPERLHRFVRGDLDSIVMKALEKDRARRYETAGSLADDVGRFMADDPIEARPPSTRYRVWKFLRRNRTAVVTACIFAIVLCVGFVATVIGWMKAIAIQNELTALLIDDAFAYAVGGDDARAMQMSERAQKLGATQEYEQLIRGVVALYQGDTQEAVRHLDGVRGHDIGEVAQKSLLGTALLHAGSIDECFPIAAELSQAKPVTDYDYLFGGHAKVYLDCESAVDYLEEVVRRRPGWGLAHAMLAEALTEHALETGAINHVEKAIEHTTTARSALPGNPYAISVFLHANHVAARMGEREGADTSAWEVAAEKAALALEPFDEFTFGRWLRAMYYEYSGDNENAEEDYRALGRVGEGRLWKHICSGYLYKIDKTEEAMSLDFKPLMLADLPDGSERAAKAYREFVLTADTLPIQVRTWRQQLLVLLDRRDEAKANWCQMARTSNITLPMINWPLKLFAGEMTPEEALQMARSRGSRKYTAAAHYYVAMKYLHDGNRDMAKRHLQEVITLDMFVDDLPHIAAAYLNRMERDPVWPRLRPSPTESE